ncbi:MAG: 4-(cytidine 5'-diphospho)-2-C-methyl-D-erythritol kinase, partial [Clostridia bacterium]|nr:4-(cytidine 5'-diphospho)-2-C-methyl-D-erythritol kinase [Clostridia bacterium]
KRPDGFHNIESIMQTISLYDYLTLTIEPSNEFEIKLSGTSPEIPYNESNLVHKAIMLFIENSNMPAHKINVHIEKNIPVSAGLAG